jgi:GMP synthase-like glutamine amidotransferase
MKPVAIVRYAQSEGPGYFATFLDSRSIPWQMIAVDRGDAVSARAETFSGLCLMGGPMSVNDPLPWIAEVCALIRAAVAANIPVLGHCLGGQLISHALGGRVGPNPAKEIGWGKARVAASGASGDAEPELARRWLGDWLEAAAGLADVFQWHGESFSLPPGARRLLTNEFCANQAFVLGPHLALQCHVEMTPEMIAQWCAGWPAEVRGLAALPPCVQTPEQMAAETDARLPAMRRLADQLYSVWVEGLKTL